MQEGFTSSKQGVAKHGTKSGNLKVPRDSKQLIRTLTLTQTSWFLEIETWEIIEKVHYSHEWIENDCKTL
jgi:hypothetical protein